MKRFKFFTLFLAVILPVYLLQAQKGFEEGYVVTVEGDTIRGTVDYKKWDKTPKRIRFRSSTGESDFRPLDIRSFYVAYEYYESAIVNVDHSAFETHNLESSGEPNFSLDTIFVQSVFRGAKNLYYHKDSEAKIHFFIRTADESLRPLVYKKYFVVRNVKGTQTKLIAENLRYRNQLLELFKDCAQLRSRIESVPYDLNGLKRLFSDYSDCMNVDVEYKEDAKKFRTNLQAVAGMNLATLQFNSAFYGYDLFEETDFDASFSPDLGFGVSIQSLRRGAITLGLFAMYSSINFSGNHLAYIDENNNATTNFTFKYHCLRAYLNVGARPLKNLENLYVTVGGSFGALLESDVQRHEIETFYSQTIIQDLPFESKSSESGFTLSLGYQIKKINIEFMFERTDGISSYEKLGSTIDRYHLLLKYNLFSREGD